MEGLTYTKESCRSLKQPTINHLGGLTLGDGGLMRRRLSDCIRKKTGVTYQVRDSYGSIVGWSLVSKLSSGKNWVNVFVHPKWRRQGIGTELARLSKRWHRNISGSHCNTPIYERLGYGEITFFEVYSEMEKDRGA